MKLKALDHVNIITGDLEGSAAFYKGLLGLDVRPHPMPEMGKLAMWLFDAAGRAVVHLNHSDMPKVIERDVTGRHTGALHHVAFTCEGHEEMLMHLKTAGISHSTNEIPMAGLKQIFLEDPNGVLLELNFQT